MLHWMFLSLWGQWIETQSCQQEGLQSDSDHIYTYWCWGRAIPVWEWKHLLLSRLNAKPKPCCTDFYWGLQQLLKRHMTFDLLLYGVRSNLKSQIEKSTPTLLSISLQKWAFTYKWKQVMYFLWRCIYILARVCIHVCKNVNNSLSSTALKEMEYHRHRIVEQLLMAECFSASLFSHLEWVSPWSLSECIHTALCVPAQLGSCSRPIIHLFPLSPLHTHSFTPYSIFIMTFQFKPFQIYIFIWDHYRSTLSQGTLQRYFIELTESSTASYINRKWLNIYILSISFH